MKLGSWQQFPFLIWCMCAGVGAALGQTAQLSGLVKDGAQAVIPNAQIIVINEENGFKRTATSNEAGYYTVPFLPPGSHKVMVQAAGFQTLSRPGVRLNIGQVARIDFVLQVGPVRQTIVVQSQSWQETAMTGVLIHREFVENLPLSGRSFHRLIELAPGVAPGKNYGVEEGQYSVNGQRASANNLMIDGVNANLAAMPLEAPNQPAGTTLPVLTPNSGLNHLAALDALQEVRVQTAAYAPEFGRTPGAQIVVSTRAGTNEWHGLLFERFSHDRFQANDWFVNRYRLPKAPMRLHDFGGFLGGPLAKDRAFFFLSYEGMRWQKPRVGIRTVPSLKARESVAPALKPLLAAYPLPTGANYDNERAESVAVYSTPAVLDAFSLRLDHPLNGRQTLFARYNRAPASADARFGGLSSRNTTRSETDTVTVGMTGGLTRWLNHDLRVNWSSINATSQMSVAGLGAVAPEAATYLPAGVAARDALFGFYILDASAWLSGQNAANGQRQLNALDNFSADVGAHQLKFGFDYRWAARDFAQQPYRLIAVFNSVKEVLNNRAAQVQVSSAVPQISFAGINFSAFAQDTWRATPRLTLTYGLRWELSPPPSEVGGREPYALNELSDPTYFALAERGTPLWRTTYGNLAPRIGLAYRVRQAAQNETVLRSGFGVYHDVFGVQAANALSGSFPYRTDRLLTNVAWPLTVAQAAAPALDQPLPYGTLAVFDPRLRLPYTLEWNVTVEQALGKEQTLSVAYVATAGRRLLRMEQWRQPAPAFTTVFVTRNVARSDYHSLQVQFQRRVARGIQTLAAYTWSHALDTASDDSSRSVPVHLLDLRQERGASGFDVRYLVTAAVAVELPSPARSWLRGGLRNWVLDGFVNARSALPVNVITGTDVLHIGLNDVTRPDVGTGVPQWLNDTTAPGGRRLNRAAFSVPVGRQGNLARNALRGFGFSQFDLALRRQFSLSEHWQLQVRADCFNLLNHPNFGDPFNRLDRLQFGQSLYQAGEKRSVQLAIKLQF
jgi:hypothetical protein